MLLSDVCLLPTSGVSLELAGIGRLILALWYRTSDGTRTPFSRSRSW